jgi:hypothetical protein
MRPLARCSVSPPPTATGIGAASAGELALERGFSPGRQQRGVVAGTVATCEPVLTLFRITITSQSSYVFTVLDGLTLIARSTWIFPRLFDQGASYQKMRPFATVMKSLNCVELAEHDAGFPTAR